MLNQGGNINFELDKKKAHYFKKTIYDYYQKQVQIFIINLSKKNF